MTFNDHEGSTKSYEFTRRHYHPAVFADFVPPEKEILAEYEDGKAMPVKLHDGSSIVLRKVAKNYDPADRGAAFQYVTERQAAGEIATGLLFIDESQPDMHDVNQTAEGSLARLDFNALCPGSQALDDLQERFR